MILVIMSVFDPLAICLVVSGAISLRECLSEKKSQTVETVSKPVLPTPQKTIPVTPPENSTSNTSAPVNSYLAKKFNAIYDKYKVKINIGDE